MTRAQLRLIFLGRWWDAGVAPPNTSPAERREIAAWVRAKCARPTMFPDPLHFIVRLGFRPVEQKLPGMSCELTDGHTIYYPPTLDQRDRGRHAYHGLAHCVLLQHFLCANETDAVLLEGELVYPTPEARKVRTLEQAIEAQQHAPTWLILFQLACVKLQRKAA